jgi:hypothetical protein
MILAWKALCSSSVLWRTQRWELMADMILQENQQDFLPKIIQKKNILVSVIKFGRITAVARTFVKKTENITIKSKEFQHGRYPKNIPKKSNSCKIN